MANGRGNLAEGKPSGEGGEGNCIPCEDLGLAKEAAACPLRGRNMWRLTTGSTRTLVHESFGICYNALVPHIGGVSSEARTELVAELYVARDFTYTEFVLRYSVAESVPHKVMCLGHPNQRIARTHFAICVVLAERCPASSRTDLINRRLFCNSLVSM